MITPNIPPSNELLNQLFNERLFDPATWQGRFRDVSETWSRERNGLYVPAGHLAFRGIGAIANLGVSLARVEAMNEFETEFGF